MSRRRIGSRDGRLAGPPPDRRRLRRVGSLVRVVADDRLPRKDALPVARPLVLSTSRVRDLAEVLTPQGTVAEMLGLLPDDVWSVHPSRTFLEPACGDGNFLLAVLDRKLAAVLRDHELDRLPGGSGVDGLHFHLLEALSSLYGIDISEENIVGFGDDGHPGARERLLVRFLDAVEHATGRRPVASTLLRRAAEWIIARNVIVGDTLLADPTGRLAGAPELEVVEYRWDPNSAEVAVLLGTLTEAIAHGRDVSAARISLFDDDTEKILWSGSPLRIFDAPVGGAS